MLTVKHYKPEGEETIHLAREVIYHPPRETENQRSAETLFIETPEGKRKCLGSWGSFYVMNETGATVAKYDFGGWASPQDEGLQAASKAEAA